MSAGTTGPRPATEASLRARIAAHERWAHTADRTAATAPGRAGLEARFEREVDPKGELDPAEHARRVDAKRKAHFMGLALLSVRARRAAAEARAAASHQTTTDTESRPEMAGQLPSTGRCRGRATERFSPPLRRSAGDGPACSPPHGALVRHPSTATSASSRPMTWS